MKLRDFIEGNKKTSHDELRKSEDFRKDKKFSEPKIPFFSTDFAFPYLGIIKGYYISLLVLFLLFIFTKSSLVGLFAGANILFIVLWEFYVGSKTGGIKNELKDTIIAVGLGLIVWFGSGFVLNTPTPINAIVSCSMLPSYERGDMIILQGEEINTQYVQYDGSIEDLMGNITISPTYGKPKLQGSLYSYCTQDVNAVNEEICMQFLSNPSQFTESHGPLEFQYGRCTKYNPSTGKKIDIACVKNTSFNGEKIEFSKDYDLIVYQPKKDDLYALVGDIIHRARFGVNTSNGVYYFTKGDNNPVYDFQIYSKTYRKGNTPVEQQQIKGKSILRIPFIGNFKLFITPQVLFLDDESTGCNMYFVD